MKTMDLDVKTLDTLEGAEREEYAARLVAAGLICEGFGCPGCRHCDESHPEYRAPGQGGNRFDAAPARGRSADGVTSNQFGTFQNHPASEAQLRFLERLLSERPAYRDVMNLWPNNLAKLTKKAASKLIDEILEEAPNPEVAAPAGIVVAAPVAATDVEAWLEGLGRKVEPDDVTPELAAAATEWAKAWDGSFEFMVDMRAKARQGSLSQGMAKGVLNCWRADIQRRPKATKGKPAAEVTEDGMYRTPDGEIFKVQIAHHGSGNLYAKRLVVGGGKGRFEYEAGAIRKLRPEWKMTLEEAKEFGRLYGVCCNCAAVLTDEDSIAAGIGPVCATKF